MATQKKDKKSIMVWHSLVGVHCQVSAWGMGWIKITHPKFKGARVFKCSGKNENAWYCFSVPAADGTVQAYKVIGPVCCNPALFVG